MTEPQCGLSDTECNSVTRCAASCCDSCLLAHFQSFGSAGRSAQMSFYAEPTKQSASNGQHQLNLVTHKQHKLADMQMQLPCREANYVIHCAAAIRFDMHIQEILGQTFTPTENLLKLASRTPGMRCFCFMSTAFVNANLPKGTCVQERIYPLRGTSYADGSSLARRLLQLPPELAEAEVRGQLVLAVC